MSRPNTSVLSTVFETPTAAKRAHWAAMRSTSATTDAVCREPVDEAVAGDPGLPGHVDAVRLHPTGHSSAQRVCVQRRVRRSGPGLRAHEHVVHLAGADG